MKAIIEKRHREKATGIKEIIRKMHTSESLSEGNLFASTTVTIPGCAIELSNDFECGEEDNDETTVSPSADTVFDKL